MYLSYKTTYKHEQERIVEWNTVEVVDEGRKVMNKNGATIGIEPLLRLDHFFHEDPKPEYPKK